MPNNNKFNILFLCTGNSARSIMAEALLNRLGNEKCYAFSAGSKPKGKVHPKTIETLENYDFDIRNFRSKSWDEFCGSDAPKIDLVITVCSNAANESCPIFPGKPISLHWDFDDPARDFDSIEKQTREFETVFNELKQRIQKLTESLNEPTGKSMTKAELQKYLNKLSG